MSLMENHDVDASLGCMQHQTGDKPVCGKSNRTSALFYKIAVKANKHCSEWRASKYKYLTYSYCYYLDGGIFGHAIVQSSIVCSHNESAQFNFFISHFFSK